MRSLNEWLTRGSVDLSLLCYFFAVALLLASGRERHWQLRRAAWTLGCLAFLSHVAFAFGIVHQWSHRHALDTTATRVEQTMGFEFGEGIFVSYLFTLCWLVDVGWWWFSPEGYLRRSRWVEGAWQFFAAFMFINGAIIFESGGVRYGAAAGFVFLGLLWMLPAAQRSFSANAR